MSSAREVSLLKALLLQAKRWAWAALQVSEHSVSELQCAQQLRERSWWSGADLYIVVDDYDLVASSAANPMLPLVELLPHSRDIGLHLIVARTSSGAARTMTDPVIRALRELATPGLLLSGGREDGPLIGSVSATAQPPGRGILVRRNKANLLVQTPWRPPAEELGG